MCKLMKEKISNLKNQLQHTVIEYGEKNQSLNDILVLTRLPTKPVTHDYPPSR